VVLPALCLGYDLLQRRDHLRRRLPAYGAMAAVTGLYLAGVGHFLRRAAFEAPVRPLAEQFWTQVKAVVFYLRLLAVPRGLSVDHQFQLSSGPNDPIAVSAFLALGSAALVLLLQFRRRPRVAFLALWFLVSLAPASAVPLNVLVNEHRLYLPSAAFAVALGLCWQAWSDRYRGRCEGRRPLAPAAAMLVCLAALTWQRSQVWASDYALWRDAAGKAPLMARPHMMLAEAHARDGYAERAAAAMAKALERDPGYAPGYEMLGRLHRQAGRLDTAEAWLRRGLARDPDRAGLWGELGTSLVQRAARASGEGAAALYSEALDAFSRAAALEPDEIAHRNNLGNCLQVLGRPAEALAHHRAALRLAPRDPETLLNLGNAHQMLGNLDSAEARYRQALAADGAFAGAWANLGSVLDRQGRAAAALDAYRRAAGLDSRYAPLVRHRQAGPSGRRP